MESRKESGKTVSAELDRQKPQRNVEILTLDRSLFLYRMIIELDLLGGLRRIHMQTSILSINTWVCLCI